MSNFSPKKGNHISFLPSTMILKCSEGMYVTYTSEIFPDPRSKKQVFLEQCLGLFLAELGIFLPFCARPPHLTRIAGIGLGTRPIIFQGTKHHRGKIIRSFALEFYSNSDSGFGLHQLSRDRNPELVI